jgi:hypothetical protein
MGFGRFLSILVLGVAVAIGGIGKIKPQLFLKLPYLPRQAVESSCNSREVRKGERNCVKVFSMKARTRDEDVLSSDCEWT